MKSKILQSFIVASALMLSGSAFAADNYYGTVTDCQGHSYPIVKIGDQYWMGENLQCTKYDTQSERAGAVLSTSSSSTLAPYYKDSRNVTTEKSYNLTAIHRRRLGLLYNWAAAVGVATAEKAEAQISSFSGKRQGICPNGWHLPTDAELDALGAALGGEKHKFAAFLNVGKKLKSTSGWNDNGNGTDDYSFAALPAGLADGSEVVSVGTIANFWTATPTNSFNACWCSLTDGSNHLMCSLGSGNRKRYALSVRCIKNSPVVVSTVAKSSNHKTVTDCQGHTYPVVKIGDQYWMGENLQCTKYDTKSERAGATLSTSSSSTCAPYYTDGRNATTEFSDNLTSTQRKKLGLLYNWAAAVGLATEGEAVSRTTSFSGRRQGICPNGWHIPSDAEWIALGIALGGIKDYDGWFTSVVGKKLKATTGWYSGGNGTDEHSFTVLPAGGAVGSKVLLVGKYTYFFTTTTNKSDEAYCRCLSYKDNIFGGGDNFKRLALSVRCVKD